MSLIAYQRAFLAQLFAAQAVDAGLGDPARLAIYRGMAQRRLLGLARSAFRHTRDVLGEPAFDALFARFLDRAPPRTPAMRDAVHAFADFARGELPTGAPAHVGDLLGLEALLWRSAYAEDGSAGAPGALDFALPPAFASPLALFEADYPVQRIVLGSAQSALAPVPTRLVVYRDAADVVRWRVCEPLLGALLAAHAEAPQHSLTALALVAAAGLGRAVDDAFLAELSDGLTSALGAGILRGSRLPE